MLVCSASDGETLAEQALEAPPVFDGLMVAGARVYLVDRAGAVRCFGKE